MVVTGSVATALEKTGQVCVSAELQGKPDLGSGVWSDNKNHIKRYMSDYGKNLDIVDCTYNMIVNEWGAIVWISSNQLVKAVKQSQLFLLRLLREQL